jgi:hypothetical protein
MRCGRHRRACGKATEVGRPMASRVKQGEDEERRANELCGDATEVRQQRWPDGPRDAGPLPARCARTERWRSGQRKVTGLMKGLSAAARLWEGLMLQATTMLSDGDLTAGISGERSESAACSG